MDGSKDRKHPLSGGALNTRDFKRAKLRSARTIMANNQEPALRDGRLDVPDFLAARKYEIQQMERAMQNSRQAAKQRAFQSLPRVLRRRTASHNVKRIPKRLRKRAEREMADDKTPALAKKNKKLRGYARVKQLALERRLQRAAGNKTTKLNPNIVYNRAGINELAKPPPGKAKFQHRQKDKKVWLPTHVWHAKRAHLETRWGFSVVKKPTQKAYRPTHRASNLAGAVAWDKSYFSTLILEEKMPNNGALQKVICKLTNTEKLPAVGDRYTNGSRSWHGLIFDEKSNILGPGMIYWSKRTSENIPCRVLVRVHPAMFSAVFSYLQLLLKETEQEEFTMYDCRFTIGSIDITGPASLPALASVLKLQDDNDNHELTKLWKILGSISNTASLPKNVVLTLMAKDPRFSYPPQPVRKVRNEEELIGLITGWSENEKLLVKESPLFTPDALNESYKNQSSQKQVERRKRAAGSGKEVTTSDTDPRIPVILFKNPNNSWTILLPWGWVLPVWHSLMHLNDVHIGGTEQEHQIAFESGRLYFPDDYPGTPAGVAAENENSKERKEIWIRKPVSKRVSYGRIKIRGGTDVKRGEEGSPFKCDWRFLTRTIRNLGSESVDLENEITAEKILEEVQQIDEVESSSKPATHTLKPNKGVYECPVLPRYVRFQHTLLGNIQNKNKDTVSHEALTGTLEIIPVRLNFVQRGSPSATAHIYRLPEGFEIAKHKKHNKNSDEKIYCPPTDHLIGFVTTGTYNLMEGNGYGVGSIVADTKGPYCLVRNVGSATTRLAKWERIVL